MSAGSTGATVSRRLSTMPRCTAAAPAGTARDSSTAAKQERADHGVAATVAPGFPLIPTHGRRQTHWLLLAGWPLQCMDTRALSETAVDAQGATAS